MGQVPVYCGIYFLWTHGHRWCFFCICFVCYDVQCEQRISFCHYGRRVSELMYIFFALIIFFPSLYLFNFSSKMRKAFQNNDQQVLSDSLKSLKSFFKFYGIFTVIILSIYALAIIAGIIGAMVGHRA